MKIDIPKWAENAVFYQIFPDRFAKSDRVKKPTNLESWQSPPTLYGFKGGDLLGVEENIDYLADLGINAIYLNPIFSSTANHRYHTFDFFQVDPLLGGNKALKQLLETAHRKNIKVVLDGVFNHASRGFFQFNHTLENGLDSPYIDWFHFNKDWLTTKKPLNAYPLQDRRYAGPTHEGGLEKFGYRAWWDLPALPKFNTDNPMVKEFILEVAEFWLDFGIDGWRLDVPGEIDDTLFWQEFRTRCRKVNKDAYLVGEIWGEAKKWLQGDQFDATMNYPVTHAVIGHFFADCLNREEVDKSGYRSIKSLSHREFKEEIESIIDWYHPDINNVQFNLLGSHDTPRLLTVGNGAMEQVKLAYVFLLTFPGAPCIYYGDEIGMTGGYDPECRAGFEWQKEKWDVELRQHIKGLISRRHEDRALHRGDFKFLPVNEPIIAYQRRFAGEESTVFLNLSGAKQEASFGEKVVQLRPFGWEIIK